MVFACFTVPSDGSCLRVKYKDYMLKSQKRTIHRRLRRARRAASLTIVLSVAFVIAATALAAPGDLDPAFNATGIVTTAIGSAADRAWAVALQPDGKIVAAGTSRNGTRDDFAVARYNPNGTPDTSFNGTGKVTTAISVDGSDARAVLIQPDGKIVVAGASSSGPDSNYAVVRYNADGSLDTSFDGDGIAVTVVGNTPPASESAR